MTNDASDSLVSVSLAHERHANDITVENHGGTYESLNIEDGPAPIVTGGLADQDQAIAGSDRCPEAHVLQAAKSDEVSLKQVTGDGVIRAELRRRLAHQDT